MPKIGQRGKTKCDSDSFTGNPNMKVTSHSIRKTATSKLVENKASYEDVRPLLGHKAAEAVFHYHRQSMEYQSNLVASKL